MKRSMIELAPNHATTQHFYVTPYEARKDNADFTHYLVSFTTRSTDFTQYFIANVRADNERYTKVGIITDTNDVLNGDIKITGSGQFDYIIRGQNSSSNLDPDDSSVVGTLEFGTGVLTAEAIATIPAITIPDNVVYYQ